MANTMFVQVDITNSNGARKDYVLNFSSRTDASGSAGL